MASTRSAEPGIGLPEGHNEHAKAVDISPQSPFVLDAVETCVINTEIVAATFEKVFEHPDNDIASTITVPPWPIVPRAETVVGLSRRPTRWCEGAELPAAALSRSYLR